MGKVLAILWPISAFVLLGLESLPLIRISHSYANDAKIAAPPKFLCCVRERFLHLHPLRQQKAGLSANCEFTDLLISRLRRKSAMTGRTAAFRVGVERRLWAVHDNCEIENQSDCCAMQISTRRAETGHSLR
jgi:hypothetical protein